MPKMTNPERLQKSIPQNSSSVPMPPVTPPRPDSSHPQTPETQTPSNPNRPSLAVDASMCSPVMPFSIWKGKSESVLPPEAFVCHPRSSFIRFKGSSSSSFLYAGFLRRR